MNKQCKIKEQFEVHRQLGLEAEQDVLKLGQVCKDLFYLLERDTNRETPDIINKIENCKRIYVEIFGEI